MADEPDEQEAVMAVPQQSADSAGSAIEAVRESWLDALRTGDVERLGILVTDDVVVVHGTGRCVSGREELMEDFRNAFGAFSIEQNVSPMELLVRGGWALEIADARTELTPRSGGERMAVQSTTVTALKRQPDGSWKISRALGLVDSPPSSAK
jgi:uncharacterized protein (TIGR02246 family)